MGLWADSSINLGHIPILSTRFVDVWVGMPPTLCGCPPKIYERTLGVITCVVEGKGWKGKGDVLNEDIHKGTESAFQCLGAGTRGWCFTSTLQNHDYSKQSDIGEGRGGKGRIPKSFWGQPPRAQPRIVGFRNAIYDEARDTEAVFSFQMSQ